MFKKLFIHSPIKYLISFILLIVFVVINLITLKNTSLTSFANAFLNSGVILILIGGLSLVTFYGAFDTFKYSFSTMRRGSNRKYTDLHEYNEIQNERRAKRNLIYMPYFVIGCLGLIIGVILKLCI